MAIPMADSYPGTPGTTLYAGLPTPSVGGLITTLSLVNTSGSTQAANFVSPMLGMPFKAGDMPSGQYPQFQLTDNTPCPATIWGVTLWPDGSMKWCGAMIRVPTTIAGSGTLTINVKNGGSAPSASSRGTSDFTAADLKTELTGVTNLSGVWTASLNTAITDATDIVVLGDGPAGKVYRIGGPCKQSGAAHGQLHCWHYAVAIQNSSGALLGLRYLGRVIQPWTDITSPAVAKRDFTAVLKSGATSLRTLQGIQAGETTSGTISLTHYASLYTCATDGKWDFVQGGGSASADCTVRVVQDMTYVVKSRMTPPFDRAQTITAPSSIDYVPGCQGNMNRIIGTSGERDDIGVFPAWYVKHIISPTATTERCVRVNGLATGGWRVGLRQSTTLQPPAVVDVQSSYTGLGTVQPTWRYWTSGVASGVNAIPAAHLWDEEYDIHHRPQGAFFPYLVTGEPQYLDMLVEQASSLIMLPPPGADVTWKTTLPIMNDPTTGSFHSRDNIIAGTTYKGSGLLMRQDLARYAAWSLRDLGELVGIYPTVCPYGTAIKSYVEDVLDQNYAAFEAYRQAMPASYRNDGLFNLRSVALGASDHPWCIGYLCNTLAHTYSITGKSNIYTIASHFANFGAGIASRWDIATACSIESYPWLPSGERLNSLDGVAFNCAAMVHIFDAATDTVTKSGFNAAINITNGDLILSSNTYISSLPTNTRLYAVNSTGSSWQLSLTPGGSVVNITSSGTKSGNQAMTAQNFSPKFSFEDSSNAEGYLANLRGVNRHLEAIGITAVNAARVGLDAKWVVGTGSFNNNPKNAMTASYPV